jgi:flavin reductase (DIM6/NTAB) family NADH-FMN oxidoreductase RutF
MSYPERAEFNEPSPDALPPDFAATHFRRALSQFATGVTIITTLSEQGEPIGFTASSFNSVSLDPPLVLWSLASSAGSFALFHGNTHYAINVLSARQIEMSRRFGSRSGPGTETRFDGVEWRRGSGGAPVIVDCCAWFECYNRSRYHEGDHVIFVGEVERCGFTDAEPLIFQNGRYHRVEAHPDTGNC